MNLPHSFLKTFTIALMAAASFGQPSRLIEPSFSLSLSGKYGYDTSYHYLLNKAGDSGVIIVQGLERPLGWKDFRKIKSAIIEYAMDLTEASYGAPRDSADFSGEIAIAALDRNHVIKLSAALTIGTLADGPMTGLLRLLMQQVADTLRLPQFTENERNCKPNILKKGMNRKQ
jgi:hypothetical protein